MQNFPWNLLTVFCLYLTSQNHAKSNMGRGINKKIKVLKEEG